MIVKNKTKQKKVTVTEFIPDSSLDRVTDFLWEWIKGGELRNSQAVNKDFSCFLERFRCREVRMIYM